MTDLSVPNTFSTGPAVAAEVNANFDAIETFVNVTGAPVIQDGAVSSADKLASGVVTHAKMDAKTMGQQVTSGYQRVTSAVTGVFGSTTIMSGVTVDGQSSAATMMVSVSIHTINLSDPDAYADVILRADGNVLRTCRVGGAGGHAIFQCPVGAFTGTKTFSVTAQASSGTADFAMSSSSPGEIRATWAPGLATS